MGDWNDGPFAQFVWQFVRDVDGGTHAKSCRLKSVAWSDPDPCDERYIYLHEW